MPTKTLLPFALLLASLIVGRYRINYADGNFALMRNYGPLSTVRRQFLQLGGFALQELHSKLHSQKSKSAKPVIIANARNVTKPGSRGQGVYLQELNNNP